MIDTPAVDDIFRTDADVLQDVASCLKLTYECDMKLTGIIYLHRITDLRITHDGIRSLAMFRKLCGSEAMKNVILATTFWNQVDPQEAKAKLHKLQTNPLFWAEMLAEGARVEKYDDAHESAVRLIEMFIPKDRVKLQIQKEMCDRGLALAETQAGQYLSHEFVEQEKHHIEEMAMLPKEMEKALKTRDDELLSAVQRLSAEKAKTIVELRARQAGLRSDHRNEIGALEQDFVRLVQLEQRVSIDQGKLRE